MRVLFINTVFGKGSTGRIVKQLGDAIEVVGGEYMVAYGRGEIVDKNLSYFIGSIFDRYVHAGISRFTDRAGFYSKKCTEELVFFIRKYNPDIIHLHNLHGYYINLPVLFGYLKNEYKGKIIWTLHDCWAFTGHCTHFTFAKCEKWKTGCSHCPEKNNYPSSMVTDNSRLNYEQKKTLFTGLKNMTIVTVSEWLKGVAEKSFLGEYEIIRIYNGVDTERFCRVNTDLRKRLGLDDKKIVLCISDGWNDRKGYSTVKSVAKNAPDNWKIVLIGVNKKQIKELAPNTLGIKHVWNQDELIEYYSIADTFFNPSIEETFGLVTAEALSCGTPAVVFDKTACPELIQDKKNGRVIGCGASIREIIDVIDCVMKIDKHSVNINGDRFSINVFLDNYLKLYS